MSDDQKFRIRMEFWMTNMYDCRKNLPETERDQEWKYHDMQAVKMVVNAVSG